MFDKWKTKRALCKAFDFYRQKKERYLRIYTLDTYEQLQEIEYAIAYVLCEYFDLKCDNPWSYKWYITYDYTHFYSQCKRAYEKIIEQKNKENMKYRYNYIARYFNGFKNKDKYTEGDMLYNVEDKCLYYYDGNNLIKIG
jgi:hypothetical protein